MASPIMHSNGYINFLTQEGDDRGISQRRSNLKTLFTEPEQMSSDTHEDCGSMHHEAFERVMATAEEESVLGAAENRGGDPRLLRNQILQAISDVLLEKQAASSLGREDRARFVRSTSVADPKSGVKLMSQNGVNDGLEQPGIVPELRRRTWRDFMNKYAGEKFEYAIEILVEEPNYLDPTTDAWTIDKDHDRNRTSKPESQTYKDPTSSTNDGEPYPIPDRIRINSLETLRILADIDTHIDASEPVVMLRPFKFLVQYESRIRRETRALETQLEGSDASQLPNEAKSLLVSDPTTDTCGIATTSSESESIRLKLQHMLCLVHFIDLYIMPTVACLNDSSYGKIHFRDLWYIFKPGETIYIPIKHSRGAVSIDTVTASPEAFQSRYNILWRVTGAGGGRPIPVSSQGRKVKRKDKGFRVNCYYIDFDGRYFCPTNHTFTIMPFKGEQDITSLDFYPVRFQKAAQRTIQEHIAKGQQTYGSILHSFTHFYYAGPTLLVQPCGCPIKEDPPKQEYIESEVIVDFRNTLMMKPAWRPKPVSWKPPPVDRRELQEVLPVQYWDDVDQTKIKRTEQDQVYDDYNIDEDIAMLFMEQEKIFEPIPSGQVSNEQSVPDNDVMLLPGRVFAFVLRTRTFAPLWLWRLEPIKAQLKSLHTLQLQDNAQKDQLHALVRTHFIQKNTPQSSEFEYDVVRGKGKGLVILLHGAPGVGKTFTAESVAAANGKPLFQITCGDLGLTPQEVEKALKEIFRYAQLWNCVLLLDECDIFLTRRSKDDIKRNGLVSVFLRVLEFYTGVLFLTTNRVGVLDDAIRSRLTMTLLYPPLDWKQTKEIWRVNIKHLEDRNQKLENRKLKIEKKDIMAFAKDHFWSSLDRQESPWNGRQIQNAFKVATALAEWDAYSQDIQRSTDTRVSEAGLQTEPKLSAAYFKTVAAGTLAFDEYMRETTGFTGAQRAYNTMERADEYNPHQYASVGSNNTVPQEHNRDRPTVFASQETSVRRQRISTSTSLATPQAHSRDPGPSPHPQPVSPKSFNHGWRQSSHSTSGQNFSIPALPSSVRRRSSGQQTVTTASMSSQLQSPSSRRSSHVASSSSTNAVILSPPPDPSPRARSRQQHKHQISSTSAQEWQEPAQPSYQDDDESSGLGSSEEDEEVEEPEHGDEADDMSFSSADTEDDDDVDG